MSGLVKNAQKRPAEIADRRADVAQIPDNLRLARWQAACFVLPMTSLALNVAMPSLPPLASAPDATRDAGPSDSTDFSFHNLVSIFNPLQHIPVVSTLYRALTGDTIGPLERVAGDTLYGGWMGMASSVANLVFEKATGKDFGDSVLAFVEKGDLPTLVASSDLHDAPATQAAEQGQSDTSDKTYGIAKLAALEAGHRPNISVAKATNIASTKPDAAASQAPASTQPLASSKDIAVAAPAANPASGGATKPGAVAKQVPVPLQPSASNADPGVAALETSMLGAHIDPELGQRAIDAYRKSVGMTAVPVDLAPAI
jgi:hypothetical protein